MSSTDVHIYCDGGARGNPGPAASAFVAYKNKKRIGKGSLYLGRATNNEAEYRSVLLAIEWLAKKRGTEKKVYINLDSQLVKKQLTGEYKIKKDNLKTLAVKIKKQEKSFSRKIYYRWSPRTFNKEADQLVNEVLDKQI